MPLAIFDLDGTLADTLRVDHRCFVEAFRLEHGIEFLDDDWSLYQHTTDSGITPEVIARAFGRPATAGEVARHKRRFIELLERAAAREPESFQQVPGAAALLAALGADAEWRAVIATGSWRDSALLKLALAGLDGFDLPLASAGDGLAREEIVAHAYRQAVAAAPCERVVLVGDKPWDLAAARHFGFGFLGVATAGRQHLEQAGARHLVDDFSDTVGALAVLERASLEEDPTTAREVRR